MTILLILRNIIDCPAFVSRGFREPVQGETGITCECGILRVRCSREHAYFAAILDLTRIKWRWIQLLCCSQRSSLTFLFDYFVRCFWHTYLSPTTNNVNSFWNSILEQSAAVQEDNSLLHLSYWYVKAFQSHIETQEKSCLLDESGESKQCFKRSEFYGKTRG